MLENLPPKRVCKKIFPTINKTKKNIKNIKPKLLAKHKIYNNLRKTRVRQMSQAAKILSKTKSQLQKSKKMTTRSTVAPVLATAANKRNGKQKSPNKMLIEKTTKCKPAEKTESQNNDQHKDTMKNSIKLENEKSSPAIEEDIRNDENVSIAISQTKTIAKETDIVVQSNDIIDKISEISETNYIPVQINESAILTTVNPMEASQNISQTKVPSPVKVPQEIVCKAQPNLSNLVDLERQAPNNKNVKRSKRISDCIAMLTGKLEQKLKTEQTVSVPAVNNKSVKPVANTRETTVLPSPSTPLTSIQPSHQDDIQKSIVNTPENVDIDKNSSKKTPKRKTISRRIIKTDMTEEVSSSVKVPGAIPGIVCTVPKKQVEKTTPVQELKQMPNINTTEKIRPVHVIGKDSTPSLNFAQVEGKPTIPVPPPSLVPPMPSIMPLNNQTLLPSVPLYLPVDNLCPQHVNTLSSMPMPSLPLTLPVPAPAPPPIQIENIVQQTPLAPSVVHTGAVGIGLIPPPPTAISLITTMPPAHLPGPTQITLPVSSFSIPSASEPLNLSSSSKKPQKQSQDLSFSNRQKVSGIPMRRQTICGFEARNFVMFDEMEPLDLSNKARQEKVSPSPVVPILPKSVELASILLPTQHPHSLSQHTMTTVDSASLLPVPPLTPEALLNKPFYSNLDLLRIPQVRNPVVGSGSSSAEPTPPPQQPPPPLMVGNPLATTTSKAVAKKRTKQTLLTSLTTTTNATTHVMCEPLVNTTTNSNKPNNTKDSTTIGTSKKESSVKGKVMLRMDEEVINHIDDAINSVINAVKASLDNEEAEKAQAVVTTSHQQPPLPKTTDDVNVSKELVGEFKYLTAARRNMRSKTLDCRPAALNKHNVQNSPTSQANNNQSQVVTVRPYQTITVRNIETLTVPDTNNITHNCTNALVHCDTVTENLEKHQDTCRLEEKTIEELSREKLSEIKAAGNQLEQSTTKNLNETSTAQNDCHVIPLEDSNANVTNTVKPISLDKPNEIAKTSALTTMSDADVNIHVRTAICTNLDLEQMSNNNNTSSGFHSSAQSDQQTSVMSTTTSVSTTITDTKKKQRRRRKNELAAIVADQLLESFKLDKARRDNLKKLENLAYEKSEDLLLTGMLLMSSTKRNVTSSSTVINSSVSVTSTAANDNSENSNKRGLTKSQQNVQTSKINDNTSTTTTQLQATNNTTAESDKNHMESMEASDGKKNNKRKQYRRRGKTLDNENISKLKSSLESFSIDIERQLTEYEAKNVNVFKSVSVSEVGKTQANSKSQPSTMTSKSTVILRPSILSMTLEASANVDNPQVAKVSNATTDASKTVISSRDPRLNKNIHKEGEKNTDIVIDTKPSVAPKKNSGSPEEIGDLEEDNYLTEIAKNVNEKIMSTENEEFAFKDDGFEMVNDMGMDDSNSKFSRPPTSMSCRSAPNFNDDRSNFGSMCDENTNTEVMDMDLDDEMSVYTSYSQDLGRGRGRRRRRRRSILLTRKPKKRASSRDLSAEKIECILCKKTFYSANSLSKHNMTLAHVSKVSEQEYLLSKSLINNTVNIDQVQSHGTLGPYARRSTRRATISEPPMHMQSGITDDFDPLPLPLSETPAPSVTQTHLPQSQTQTPFKPLVSQDDSSTKKGDDQTAGIIEPLKPSNISHLPKGDIDDDYEGNNGNVVNAAFNGNSRLNLNPDERLFFECCNILKSAETPRINSVIVPEVTEECNNLNTNYNTYAFKQQEKPANIINTNIISDHRPNITNVNIDNTARSDIQILGQHMTSSNNIQHNQQPSVEQTAMFRDPQSVNVPNCYNRSVQENR